MVSIFSFTFLPTFCQFSFKFLSHLSVHVCVSLYLAVCAFVRASLFSCVRLLATLWTVAGQAPLSMGFPRQEYWVGYHALLQGIFNSGVEPRSLTSTCIGKWVLYPGANWQAHLAVSLSYFVSFMNHGNIKTYFQLFIPFLAQVTHKLHTFNYFLI